MKANCNQICWLIHKVKRSEEENSGHKTFQEFLDAEQYTAHGIRCYEWIFGRGFISLGGLDTTKVMQHIQDEVAIRVACKVVKIKYIDLRSAYDAFTLRWTIVCLHNEIGPLTREQFPLL